MKKIKYTALILIIFGISQNIFAQNDSINYLDMSLEELLGLKVKIASKKTQKLSEAPSVISAFNRESIEQMGVTSLIDILNYIPGIETNIDINGYYRVSIRGIRKDGNILLLINGIPVNDFYNGKALFDLPVEMIEKIEIIRGPGSALFGTNAVAGVIDITTRNTNSVSVTGGTNNTYNGAINTKFTKKATDISVSGGYLSSDGANTEPFTEPLLANNTSESNRTLAEAYFISNIKNKALTFNLLGNTKEHGPWIGPVFIMAPDSKLQDNSFAGNISYKYELSDKVILTPKLYSTYFAHDFTVEEYPVGYKGNQYGLYKKENYSGYNFGTELQADFNISENFNITSGIVNENMKLNSYSLLHNYYAVSGEHLDNFTNLISPDLTIETGQLGKQRRIIAMYLQAFYSFKKISITAGGRFDNYSDFGSSVNPRLGIIYKAFKDLNFKFLYGQAFRAPTFNELYDKSTSYSKDGVYGNENLEPERVQSYEFSAEYSIKKLIVRTNGFYNLGTNIIDVYDPDGTGKVGKYENVGNINGYGIEAEATFMLNKSFSLFSNFLYFEKSFSYKTDGNIKATEISYLENDGDPIMYNIPRIRLNSGISLKLKDLGIFAGMNYGGESFSNDRTAIEGLRNVSIPSYFLANLSLSYLIKDRIFLKVSANNLGKIKYSDPNESSLINKAGDQGMAQPVSTILMKVEYRFGKNDTKK